MTTQTVTLGDAVRVLADLDTDRAQDRNQQGYSKADSWIGHAFAEIPEAEWAPEAAWACHQMLRKYRGQLAAYGIDYDALPEPARVAVGDRVAREVARDRAYRHRSAKRAAANPIHVELRIVGGEFVVRFSRRPPADMLDAVKAFRRRRYDGTRQAWMVALECADQVAEWVETAGADMDDETAAVLARLADAAVEEAGKPERRVEFDPDDEDRVRIIHRSVVHEAVHRIKGMSGYRWNPEARYWTVLLAQNAAAVEKLAADFGYVLEEGVADVLADRARLIVERREASAALEAEYEVEGVRETMHLYPFQRAGIRYLVEHAQGRGICGDEMGLGKTPQTMCAVQKMGAFPCVVVVPNLVKLNWLREIDLWLPGRSLTIVDTGKQRQVRFRRHKLAGGGKRTVVANDLTADFIVVNYDILSKMLGTLLAARPAAVIFDESHFLKNPKAQRTKAAKQLASAVRVRLMATGTAILNRPVELKEPLDILGRIGQFGGRTKFSKRYCRGHMDRWGHWDESGASNTDELNRVLREVCYVRRDKQDVLPELPAVQRDTLPVPITNRAEYQKAYDDVVEWARQEAARNREFLASLAGLSPEEAREKRAEFIEAAAESAGNAEALRRMTALRVLTGRGKIKAIQEWVADFLESESKLILFAYHVEVQEALLAALPGAARIMARDNPQVRDENVRRFQEDDDCHVIVVSLMAGGLGLTLTAGQHVAFAELPWRPGDVDQAEGRAYGRVNDAHGISSYYLVGEETFDLDMADMIDAKREVIDSVLSGKQGASGGSIMGALLARMATVTAEAA